MPFLELDKELSDFVDTEIDVHHQLLATLINKLHDNQGDQQATIGGLEALLEATREHFRDEEQAMEAMSFPLWEEHTTAHVRLLDTLTGVHAACLRGSAALDEQMFNALRSWLLEHIRTHDKLLDHFMRNRQPSS